MPIFRAGSLAAPKLSERPKYVLGRENAFLRKQLESNLRMATIGSRERIHVFLGGSCKSPAPVSMRPNCLQFAGHNQPPNLVICWAVNEAILSADDLKTCTANFRFNQIWA